jgi:multiple sugar transport system permease protein
VRVGSDGDALLSLPTPPPTPKGHAIGAVRSGAAGYLFVAPATALFAVFIAGPFVATIVISLFDWDLLSSARFVGLRNYSRLLDDSQLHQVLVNTVIFTAAAVVLHVIVGLALALAVNRVISSALRYFLRTAVFFPQLLSWAAVALMWKYILDPNFGFLSYYLRRIGVHPPNWLISPKSALATLIGVDLWRTTGFIFIVLLAGLQAIPARLYEAAAMDGANAWKRFWSITLPMLSPSLFFVGLITFIGAFQIFEPMFIMTSGGPGDSTRSVVMLIYETAFRHFEMGYASAMAVLVLAIIMGVTLVYFRLGRYWVYHE